MIPGQDLQSTSHFFRIVDSLLPIVVSAGLGLTAWLIVRMINSIERKHMDDMKLITKTQDDLHADIQDHKAECEKIPKALIISRMDYIEKMWQQGHLDVMARVVTLEHQLTDSREELASLHTDLRAVRRILNDKE